MLCSGAVAHITDVILSYVLFAVHVILHLISAYTAKIGKRFAAEECSYESRQYVLVETMYLEMNDSLVPIKTPDKQKEMIKILAL